MSYFVNFMDIIIRFMRTPILVYGYSFSFFDVFLFSIIGYLVFCMVGGIFDSGD